MPKKKEDKVEVPKVPSELDVKLDERADLLELREAMLSRGLRDVAALDVRLSQVNQRVKELS